MLNKLSRYQIATFVAILFHTIGLTGILFFDNTFFIKATPFNLLLSALLLVWTQKEKNKYFYFFVAITCMVGFAVEVIGVNTGLLFGDYSYGKALGFQWQKVPLVIGINWFIVLYCCGICINSFLAKIITRVSTETKTPPQVLKTISVVADGATLAVLFDWFIEPAAVKLGYWQWNGDGSIPLYNYICWGTISVLLLGIFHYLKFNKRNKFAINLFLIQILFFLLLRTFLT